MGLYCSVCHCCEKQILFCLAVFGEVLKHLWFYENLETVMLKIYVKFYCFAFGVFDFLITGTSDMF